MNSRLLTRPHLQAQAARAEQACEGILSRFGYDLSEIVAKIGLLAALRRPCSLSGVLLVPPGDHLAVAVECHTVVRMSAVILTLHNRNDALSGLREVHLTIAPPAVLRYAERAFLQESSACGTSVVRGADLAYDIAVTLQSRHGLPSKGQRYVVARGL